MIKIAKLKKINPTGIAINPDSIKAFLTGLPLQTIFSSALNSFSTPDREFHPIFKVI